MPRAPMAVEQYAEFCAPTTLSGLTGLDRRTAAAYLTTKGCNVGDGSTSDWGIILRCLGGARSMVKWLRHTKPRPTVAAFLRRCPKGQYVLWTIDHTLLVEDGEVTHDTKDNKSKRCRVLAAYKFTQPVTVLDW